MDTNFNVSEGGMTEDLGKKSRIMRSEAQWAELIEAHRRSGMTIEAFCRQERIGRSSFTRWRGQLTASSAADQKATDFLAIPIRGGAGIELELDGMQVRLDASSSKRLLEALLDRVRQTP